METNKRWIERSSYYHQACERLAAYTGPDRPADALDIYSKDALVKLFELAFALAWRTLQNYLSYEGCGKPQSAEQTINLALENGIISGREQWHDMLRDSNHKNYLYNIDEMHGIAERFYNDYVFTLNELDKKFQKRSENL